MTPDIIINFFLALLFIGVYFGVLMWRDFYSPAAKERKKAYAEREAAAWYEHSRKLHENLLEFAEKQGCTYEQADLIHRVLLSPSTKVTTEEQPDGSFLTTLTNEKLLPTKG